MLIPKNFLKGFSVQKLDLNKFGLVKNKIPKTTIITPKINIDITIVHELTALVPYLSIIALISLSAYQLLYLFQLKKLFE